MSALKVTFVVEAEGGKEITVESAPGELLIQAASRAGVVIQQSCGGVPSCTDCKVTVKEGVDTGFEPAEGPELRLLGNVYYITRERLSCQAVVKGDAKVFVPVPRRRQEKAPLRRRPVDRGINNLRKVGEKRHGDQEESQSKEKHQKGHQESRQKGGGFKKNR